VTNLASIWSPVASDLVSNVTTCWQVKTLTWSAGDCSSFWFGYFSDPSCNLHNNSSSFHFAEICYRVWQRDSGHRIQVAQLSKRDRAAGSVNFGKKWNTIISEPNATRDTCSSPLGQIMKLQHYRYIFNRWDVIGLQSY